MSYYLTRIHNRLFSNKGIRANEVGAAFMIVWVIAGILFALFLLLGTRNETPEWETEEELEEREIEENLELLLYDEEEEDLI